ncbi:hypothetical protein PPERSA_07963 [Pseudocohnilembus persalinus]|uniref:Uncharacterized protein n=1 Tax=Pseudocohnilembus persalinus TaxID=266149 RepID=A0A0V0QB66_PSEPJ|nr:hypothetical protein PPERSA_07963 [Pseudocohnilembus persalinus]|eukprot:KRW99478.1 hypothetical protein PPERSA_07963 [Pseudocohnilembus persalinus]
MDQNQNKETNNFYSESELDSKNQIIFYQKNGIFIPFNQQQFVQQDQNHSNQQNMKHQNLNLQTLKNINNCNPVNRKYLMKSQDDQNDKVSNIKNNNKVLQDSQYKNISSHLLKINSIIRWFENTFETYKQKDNSNFKAHFNKYIQQYSPKLDERTTYQRK